MVMVLRDRLGGMPCTNSVVLSFWLVSLVLVMGHCCINANKTSSSDSQVSVEEHESHGSVDQTKVQVEDVRRDKSEDATDDKHGGGAEVYGADDESEEVVGAEVTVARAATPPPHAIVSVDTFGASESSLSGNPWA